MAGPEPEAGPGMLEAQDGTLSMMAGGSELDSTGRVPLTRGWTSGSQQELWSSGPCSASQQVTENDLFLTSITVPA